MTREQQLDDLIREALLKVTQVPHAARTDGGKEIMSARIERQIWIFEEWFRAEYIRTQAP